MNKDVKVTFRLTKAEHGTLVALAKRQGVKVSFFLRLLIFKEALLPRVEWVAPLADALGSTVSETGIEGSIGPAIQPPLVEETKEEL